MWPHNVSYKGGELKFKCVLFTPKYLNNTFCILGGEIVQIKLCILHIQPNTSHPTNENRRIIKNNTINTFVPAQLCIIHIHAPTPHTRHISLIKHNFVVLINTHPHNISHRRGEETSTPTNSLQKHRWEVFTPTQHIQ